MNNPFPFKELSSLKLSDLPLDPFPEAALPAVASLGYDDFLKREKFDTRVLQQALVKALDTEENRLDSMLVLRFKDADAFRTLGFVYYKNKTIRAMGFTAAGPFSEWIKAIGSTFGDELRIRISPNGLSSSRLPKNSASILEIVKESAPLYFDEEKLAAEKKKFMKTFKLLPSMTSEIDLEKTAGLWKSYVAARQKTATADRALVLGSGSTPEQVDHLGKAIETALPPEMGILYSLNNGAKNVFENHDLLSLDEIQKRWTDWKKIFDEWPLEELTGNSKTDEGKTVGLYANPRWIPFAEDGGGNFLAFDLMPGKKGLLGQIIEFGPDSDVIRCVASHLNELLERGIQTQSV